MARKSIRGLGADLYAPATSTPDNPQAGAPAYPHNGDTAGEKATFYLSPQTLDELDQAWLTRRRRNRRVSKSSLVEEALREYLTKTAAA